MHGWRFIAPFRSLTSYSFNSFCLHLCPCVQIYAINRGDGELEFVEPSANILHFNGVVCAPSLPEFE